MPSFETFEKRRTPPASDPYMTLLKTGVVSLNSLAYEMIERPTHIEFVYDRSEKLVGVRPVKQETEFSYPVRELKSATGGTFSASAKAFMLYYDIPMERSIRRHARVIDGILCINLNDPGVDVTSERSARS